MFSYRNLKKNKNKNKNLPAFQVAKNHEEEGLWHPCRILRLDFELFPPTLIPTSLCHPIEDVTSSINNTIVQEALYIYIYIYL
jgi:hypothetical protein